MAAYASSNSATGASGSAVVTKPTGLAENDLMVAICADDASSGTFATPTDWTVVTSHTSAFDEDIIVFAKVASAADAAAADFTFTHATGTADVGAVLYRITGTVTSVNCIYRTAANSGTEPSADVFRFATGFTPDVASSLLIIATLCQSNDSSNSDASTYELQTNNPTWTERHDINHHTEYDLSTATATRTETTATGYYQVTFTGTADNARAEGILLAITDVANATHNATVITATATIVAPAATGSAQASPSVITATATINAPTATGGTNDSLWKNLEKPSAGTITNLDKPA